MKFFYYIFAVLLLTLNISLSESVVSIEQSANFKGNVEEITTITQTSSDSQQYGLQPSVMYSSIDRNYRVDRPNRRKFIFDVAMCFSQSGAFALLAVVTIAKFYELFIATNVKSCVMVSPIFSQDDIQVCKYRYCECSQVRII